MCVELWESRNFNNRPQKFLKLKPTQSLVSAYYCLMNFVALIGQNWRLLPLLQTFRQYLNINHMSAILPNMSTEKFVRHGLWIPVPGSVNMNLPFL